MQAKLDPIIAVTDVKSSSKWYQSLFNCVSQHGNSDTFEILADENKEVFLCLHHWGEHGHPSMQDQTIPVGNGLILYYKTTALHEIRANAEKMQINIVEEIHFNTNSNQQEFSFRDPDGYFWIVTQYHEYQG